MTQQQTLPGFNGANVDRLDDHEKRIQRLEWADDHQEGRVLAIDGAEQDLRAQLRTVRKEMNERFDELHAKVPSNLEKRGAAISLVIIALAQVLKSLGVDVDHILPLLAQ